MSTFQSDSVRILTDFDDFWPVVTLFHNFLGFQMLLRSIYCHSDEEFVRNSPLLNVLTNHISDYISPDTWIYVYVMLWNAICACAYIVYVRMHMYAYMFMLFSEMYLPYTCTPWHATYVICVFINVRRRGLLSWKRARTRRSDTGVPCTSVFNHEFA